MPIPLAATLIASRRRLVLQNILGKFKQAQRTTSYSIIGITRDSAGNALGNCIVHCFDTGTDTRLASTISDANGNYTILLPQNAGFFYCVGYKVGAPDVSGVTVNFVISTDAPVTVLPPLQVDTFTDMESSTDGTIMTTAIAANQVHGSGGVWHTRKGAVDDGTLTQLFVSTAQEIILRKPIKIGSTQYDDVGATRSWKMHNSVDSEYMKYVWTTVKSKVSCGFALYLSSAGVGWGTDFNLYDIMAFEGGAEFLVLSLENKSTGNGPVMLRAHTGSGNDHGNGVGLSGQTCYPIQDKWYWVTMLWDKNDQGKIKIYDMVTWNELQNSPMTLEWGTPTDSTFFAAGRYDAHGTSHINADYYIDDIIFDFTNAAWPLYPQ